MTDAWTDLSSDELAACHAWLLGLARRLADDDAQAEDLVQEAWEVAGRRGLGMVRDLRAFLAGVVRVRARRARVERRSRAEREARAARGEALPSAEELASRLELARRVADELAKLPADQRELLLLRYQEGLAPTLIARRRGVPAGTVRSQLARARDALRARLDRRHAGEREAWAAVALAPLAHELAPPALAGAFIGGASMAGWKIAAGVGAALVLGWLVWRAPRPIEPARPASAGVVEDDSTSARLPAQPAETATRTTAVVADHPPAVASAATGPVRLRVVDARSGDALPQYALQCEREGEEELVVTDEQGEAEIAARWFEAPFALVAIDDPEDRIDHEQRLEVSARPAEGGALSYAVVTGPTYRLRFNDAAPADGLVAILETGTAPSTWIGSMGRVRAGTAATAQLPWVRLDPGHANPTKLGEGPWTLTVRDDRGYYFAWKAVQQVDGVQREPVELGDGATGAIHVAVTVNGAPIESELAASAYPLVDGQTVQAGARHVLLHPGTLPYYRGSAGRALLGHLRPGPHVVYVGNMNLSTSRADVEVRAGETQDLVLDIAGPADLAPLDVVARCQTGATNMAGLIFYARRVGEDDGRLEMARWIGFEEGGAGKYRFHELGPGEWQVELDQTPTLPPWRERVQIGRPGEAPLEFLCLDEGAPPRIAREIRVVDAKSGATIPFVGITCYIDHRRDMVHQAEADGTIVIGPYMSGLAIELLVRAEGYRPLWTRITLALPQSPEPLVLALEPGWGSMLDIVQPSKTPWGDPLPGVHVKLDGVSAGFTDEHGQVLLSAAARPQKIEIELAGWRIQYGDVDPETGATQGGGPHPMWVLMERIP